MPCGKCDRHLAIIISLWKTKDQYVNDRKIVIDYVQGKIVACKWWMCDREHLLGAWGWYPLKTIHAALGYFYICILKDEYIRQEKTASSIMLRKIHQISIQFSHKICNRKQTRSCGIFEHIFCNRWRNESETYKK